MPTLSVVICDDDNKHLHDSAKSIKSLLKSIGYEVDLTIIFIPDISAKLADNTLKSALRKRPDILFIDNHFGSEGSAMWGFYFIANVKRSHPDTIFVLLTRRDFVETEFGRAYPHPDIIISKLQLWRSDKTCVNYLGEELARRSSRVKIGEAEISGSMGGLLSGLRSRGERKRSIEPEEIRSLIEQVCYSREFGAANFIEKVCLTEISDNDGKSSAVVGALEVYRNGQKGRVPGVIKFAPLHNAQQEYNNHARYVKWMLPYTWRVDVIGYGEAGPFGAVCYSFAHGSADAPITLKTIIKKKEVKVLCKILNAVLDPERQAWYSNNKNIDEELGIYLTLTRPYFINEGDLRDKETQTKVIVERICKNNGISIEKYGSMIYIILDSGKIDISKLEANIFSVHRDIRVVECISHGDLNAGNIMVRPETTDFSFIDFQHTGWHHRARDFCSLEGSIRTLFPRASTIKDFNAYLDRELRWVNEEICANRSTISKTTIFNVEDADDDVDRLIIRMIRYLFLLNFPDASMEEYILYNLGHTIWLMCFENEWHAKQEEILAAVFISSIAALRNDDIS